MSHAKILIIGSGPAGYTAAIYAARANNNPVLYEGMQPGGQLTITTEVENFPGYPEGVDANQMMLDIRNQALRFGTDIRAGVVTKVDLAATPKVVEINGGEEQLTADAVIISTGASAKFLGLPDEVKYQGSGVSACATCDGFFYRKRVVAVVGGGDTACEEATYLANLAKHVYLIVRKPYLRASQIMQDRVFNTENITVLFEHETLGLTGDGVVEGADLVKRRGQADEERVHIDIDGFFLAIGHKPNSDLFKGQLDMDEAGYLKHEPDSQRTNIPGVFVAGDVADPHFQQAITAAASGCRAAIEADHYLKTL